MVRHIDALLDKVHEMGDTLHGMNMSQWFMWLAFDVIVDLAFGEELGTVELGTCEKMMIFSPCRPIWLTIVRKRKRLDQHVSKQWIPDRSRLRGPTAMEGFPGYRQTHTGEF